MAKVKPVLRYYRNDKGNKAIYVRLSHKGVNRFKSLGIHIPPSVWKGGHISKSYSGWAKINDRIASHISKYKRKILELEDANKAYTVDDILKVNAVKESRDFLKYGRKYIRKFKPGVV